MSMFKSVASSDSASLLKQMRHDEFRYSVKYV